jgi:hypothetical protein
MTTTALTLALEALEDARDDVDAALQHAESLKGYPRTDARHAAYVEQLAKHDAAIEALRAAIAQAGEPALYVSPEQFAGIASGKLKQFVDLAPETGGYLPVRPTPGGKFTMALYTHPVADVDGDRYRWLLHHLGLVEAHAAKWDPSRHKPLLGYIEEFIDAAIAAAKGAGQ